MKFLSSVAILSLLLLSACGSNDTETNEVVRPVDAWSPFVQVAPPGNIWTVQTNEEVMSFAEDFSSNFTMYLQRQILDSGVYPMLWWSHIEGTPSRVVVFLFNYSEDEKLFFREFVSNSPLIKFVCLIETFGEDALFPRWGHPPTLLNRLENVTISAQSISAHDFKIIFHNDSNDANLVATDLVLEVYMNNKWIPVSADTISSIRHPSTDRLFFLELGTSELMISTEHFTRTFNGLYRVNVHIWHGDRSSPDFHRLTYVFPHEYWKF